MDEWRDKALLVHREVRYCGLGQFVIATGCARFVQLLRRWVRAISDQSLTVTGRHWRSICSPRHRRHWLITGRHPCATGNCDPHTHSEGKTALLNYKLKLGLVKQRQREMWCTPHTVYASCAKPGRSDIAVICAPSQGVENITCMLRTF